MKEGVASTARTGQERNVWWAHRDSQDKGRRRVSQVLMKFAIDLCVFVGSGKLLSILNKHFCKQSVQTPGFRSPESTSRMERGKKTYWCS